MSLASVREKVARLSSERTRVKNKGQIALTEKQMRIVEQINKSGRIAVHEIAQMHNYSRQAALKEIDRLVKLDIVKREGKARASYYVQK
ncbi:MAG: hypothetical protein WC838_04710 [Candidatus Margulisiibacteriota bacterium]